jgi:hypothetical protein
METKMKTLFLLMTVVMTTFLAKPAFAKKVSVAEVLKANFGVARGTPSNYPPYPADVSTFDVPCEIHVDADQPTSASADNSAKVASDFDVQVIFPSGWQTDAMTTATFYPIPWLRNAWSIDRLSSTIRLVDSSPRSRDGIAIRFDPATLKITSVRMNQDGRICVIKVNL